MLSFEHCMNKCAQRAKEQEALIGLALISRMFESYTNAVIGCFRSDNLSYMLRKMVEFYNALTVKVKELKLCQKLHVVSL